MGAKSSAAPCSQLLPSQTGAQQLHPFLTPLQPTSPPRAAPRMLLDVGLGKHRARAAPATARAPSAACQSYSSPLLTKDYVMDTTAPATATAPPAACRSGSPPPSAPGWWHHHWLQQEGHLVNVIKTYSSEGMILHFYLFQDGGAVVGCSGEGGNPTRIRRESGSHTRMQNERESAHVQAWRRAAALTVQLHSTLFINQAQLGLAH